MSADYDFVSIHNTTVLTTSGAIERLARSWPCSGMRDLGVGVIFTFATNGDLTDIEWFDAETARTIAEPEGIDGAAVVALSQDAWHWLVFVGNDPFQDAIPCHVRHKTVLSMYTHGALSPGETL